MRKFLLIVLSLFSCAHAVLLPIGSGQITEIVEFSQDASVFPAVIGENLEGESFLLPQDLAGQKKLLLVAFKRKQQADIDTWLLATKTLLEKYSSFAVYEIPVLKEFNFLMRFNINNGMRYGIDSKSQRQNTITLYLDKDKFTNSLKIESQDFVYAFLLDTHNNIIWRKKGLASKQAVLELESFLKK